MNLKAQLIQRFAEVNAARKEAALERRGGLSWIEEDMRVEIKKQQMLISNINQQMLHAQAVLAEMNHNLELYNS